MNATELYFPVLLFILLSNLVRRLASLGEVLSPCINSTNSWFAITWQGRRNISSQNNKAFLHDVTAAILVFQTEQWNGDHVVVPNQSWGSWTLFLCKRFLLFESIFIKAGHVNERLYTTFFFAEFVWKQKLSSSAAKENLFFLTTDIAVVTLAAIVD